MQSESKRSLTDDAGGLLSHLLPVSQDGGDDSEDQPLAGLKSDIRSARGRAVLIETTVAGWGEGNTAAPRIDWIPSHLGPNPPTGMGKSWGSPSSRFWRPVGFRLGCIRRWETTAGEKLIGAGVRSSFSLSGDCWRQS